MKHATKTVLLVLMITALIPAFAFAGNGQPSRAACALTGTPFELTGEVVSFERCGGLVLAAASGETITIYGLGPERYWDDTGIDFPGVGETVQVTGTVRQLNGTERYIAFSLTTGGETIELRDADTGRPLWRGIFGRGRTN
jgi:hypothetical protein